MKRIIKTHNRKKYLVIEMLVDRLNIFDKASFSEQVEKSLKKFKYPHTIFDLRNMEYIDSIGIGFFIAAKNIFNDKEREMVLVCPKKMMGVFDTINMNRFCHLFDQLDDAIFHVENVLMDSASDVRVNE